MTVVHIGYKYGLNNTGGAAIASTRLHQTLLASGVDSHYVCVWQCEKGTNVHVLPVGWRRMAYLALTKLARGLWKFTPYRKSISLNIIPLFGLEQFLRQLNPDVVHIQWINADVASFEQLGNLRKAVKPTCKIVFNLHDLNTLLAFGVHPQDNRYVEGYTSSNSTQLECWLVSRKKQMIDKLNPTFIGPSEYVASTCRKSIIGRGHPACAISNIIDPIFTYHPELCKPHDKFTILFGCFNGRKSSIKGWPDLEAALKLLPPEIAAQTEVHVFGEEPEGPTSTVHLHLPLPPSHSIPPPPVPIKILGNITDPAKLLEVYHRADVFAFPSRQETQGMTKCEALCCGLPVIAFNRTACAEGIEHGKTGWIAEDGDVRQFADGLKWCFGVWENGILQTIRSEIAKHVQNVYNAEKASDQILNVYTT